MQLDTKIKLFTFLTLLMPGTIPVIVGIVEIRSKLTIEEKLRNLAPVILALLILGIFLAPIGVPPVFSRWVVRCMTLLSVLVACSGASR